MIQIEDAEGADEDERERLLDEVRADHRADGRQAPLPSIGPSCAWSAAATSPSLPLVGRSGPRRAGAGPTGRPRPMAADARGDGRGADGPADGRAPRGGRRATEAARRRRRRPTCAGPTRPGSAEADGGGRGGAPTALRPKPRRRAADGLAPATAMVGGGVGRPIGCDADVEVAVRRSRRPSSRRGPGPSRTSLIWSAVTSASWQLDLPTRCRRCSRSRTSGRPARS